MVRLGPHRAAKVVEKEPDVRPSSPVGVARNRHSDSQNRRIQAGSGPGAARSTDQAVRDRPRPGKACKLSRSERCADRHFHTSTLNVVLEVSGIDPQVSRRPRMDDDLSSSPSGFRGIAEPGLRCSAPLRTEIEYLPGGVAVIKDLGIACQQGGVVCGCRRDGEGVGVSQGVRGLDLCCFENPTLGG